MVMSSGTEGGLSPHIVTIEVLEDNGPGPPMAIGTGLSRDLETHELGTFAQIDCVAETVSEAVKAGVRAYALRLGVSKGSTKG